MNQKLELCRWFTKLLGGREWSIRIIKAISRVPYLLCILSTLRRNNGNRLE